MKELKSHIAFSILLFINFIFAYKYIFRYSDYAILFALSLISVQTLFYYFNSAIKSTHRQIKIVNYSFYFFVIALIIFSHFGIALNKLNVDRYSVITSFLTELSKGNYPYFAVSHKGNYPGPMPFYFLIAYPFYIIGELSILSGLGYLLIGNVLKKSSGSLFLYFYLFTNLFFIWEIITRSNIFTYSVLIMLVLYMFPKFKEKYNIRFVSGAILTGLLLSTRSVFVIVYIIFFLSALVNNEVSFKRLFYFMSIAFVAFVSTFFPLLYFYYDEFWKMNPFIIQSTFLVPEIYTYGFILLSIVCSFMVRSELDKFFYSGLTLFISILIYSIYHVIRIGLDEAYMNSEVDISYFIFCTPFLIMYLFKSSSKKKLDGEDMSATNRNFKTLSSF